MKRLCNHSPALKGLIVVGVSVLGLLQAERSPALSAADPGAPGQSSLSALQTGTSTSTQQTPPFTLKAQRNLVLVKVVVRDHLGQLIDHLRKEDFRIFDNGKLQEITDFSVLRANGPPNPSSTGVPPIQPPPQAGTLTRPTPAPHFIALYFDDMHMEVTSALPVRQAAEKFLATAWRPGDYAGVFTATGQTDLDFTTDLSRVQKAVGRIMARPAAEDENDCPDITPYESYLIADMNDLAVTQLAQDESRSCNCPPEMISRGCVQAADQMALSAAHALWEYTRQGSQATLDRIGRITERMAALPGERTLAFVSPGLIIAPNDRMLAKLVDLAIRSQVTVNSLDAQGVFVLPSWLHAKHLSGYLLVQKMSIVHEEANVADEPLSDLAEGTGGAFFHNDNDLISGFKEVTAWPPVEYLLGFSPSDLKSNGAFHTLKVQIVSSSKLQIKVRKGYLAPTSSEEARTGKSDRIEAALYANDSSRAFPIALRTQRSITTQGETTLSITIHVDIRHLQFHRQARRRVDKLIFRTALFGAGNQYVAGDERTLNLSLDSARFRKLSISGINGVTRLLVAPGTYVLREVVAEEPTNRLATNSQPVQIP